MSTKTHGAAALSVTGFACVPVVIKLTASQSEPFLFNTVAMTAQTFGPCAFVWD